MDWASGVGAGVLRWQQEGEWQERRFEVYHYTASELDRLLREAGFSEAAFYGDLDGRPFGPGTRMVVVARHQ